MSNQLNRSLVRVALIVCLVAALLVNCMTCAAAAPECRLTVKLLDNRQQPIDGLQVYMTKVADINGTDYYPADGFENSGISIAGIVNDPSAENARNIYEFVQHNGIAAKSALSADGKAEFTSVSMGIWLVYCGDNGAYTFSPYIVFLPYAADGKLHYELVSTPKTDENRQNDRSIYVVKRWDDNNNSAGGRPDSITVELLRDGKVISTAKLNKDNGWSYTFTKLPDDGKYTVSEAAVKNYKATYGGDSKNGFVITNTYSGEKLPQTGQLWWPIVLALVAGAAFILLGIIDMRVKKDESSSK